MAKDAAEHVVVEYEPLQAIVDTVAAARPDAPRLYDGVPNVCIDADVGDMDATAAAFARATYVAKLETSVQRVTGVPLEPRAAIGIYDSDTKRYTLHAGSGGVVRQKHELATVAWCPACRCARRVRRCWRKFRHAKRVLSGVRARSLGSQACRPPRQVDLRTIGSFRLRLSRA